MFSITLIGDSVAGKGRLLSHFADDERKLLVNANKETAFRKFELNGKTINFQLFDPTPSQERFRRISSNYYRAHGIIIVYSVTDRESFSNVPKWIAEINRFVDSFIQTTRN